MVSADSFGMAHTIKNDLQSMNNFKISVSMMKDSLSLFSILMRASMTTEKGFIADLKIVKNAYDNMEAQGVALSQSKFHIPDGLTKVK